MPALLWGVAFANILRGVPIDADGNYTGTLFTLLNPYGLLGGLATVALFCTYGAIFVALKTVGTIREDARFARRRGSASSRWCSARSSWLWTLLAHGDAVSRGAAPRSPRPPWSRACVANAREREGWAFGLVGAGIVGVVATLFVALYPDVMPSSTDPAFSLTIDNASSTPAPLP